MNDQLKSYTTSALVGHRGHVWGATWPFQTKVGCGRRVKGVKASSSASGEALLVTFHPSAVHVLVLFEQKLNALHISSVNCASLFGCVLFLYCSLANTKQLINEEGKRKPCVTAVQLWPCPLGSGVVILQSIVWFLLLYMEVGRSGFEDELGLLLSLLLSRPRVKWSVIIRMSGCFHFQM